MMDKMLAVMKVLLIVPLVAGGVLAMPYTTQVSGSVSGVWGDSQNPYPVVGDRVGRVTLVK
jgi:hypothetical protein